MTLQSLSFSVITKITPFFNNSYVVYHFNCPGCCASYIGKTRRTLHERCFEHAWSDKVQLEFILMNVMVSNILKILCFLIHH